MNSILNPSPGGGAPARLPEVCLVEVRGPNGELVRNLAHERAQLLVADKLGAEVRSPSGVLRYIRLHRNPAPRGFAATIAEDNFTTAGPPKRPEAREHHSRRCEAYGRRLE